MTSQSRVMVRSPSCLRSTTARSARPIRRWISWVRPLCRPRVASRGVRVSVDRGNMLYSAVIQPLPEPFRNEGTVSSMEAVQITRVFPTSIRTEPSAVETKSGVMFTGRICSAARLSERKIMSLLFFNVNQLDIFNRISQERAAEPAEFLHRIRGVAAQAPGPALAAVFPEQLGNFDRCRFGGINNFHLRWNDAPEQRANERVVGTAQHEYISIVRAVAEDLIHVNVADLLGHRMIHPTLLNQGNEERAGFFRGIQPLPVQRLLIGVAGHGGFSSNDCNLFAF